MFLQYLNAKPFTDIQRAVQFYFLITRSFGGRGETFGTVKKSCGGASKSQRNVLDKIDAIHRRLDKVMIENRDFEKLIKQYDFEGAFFYCDPPYSKGCGYVVISTADFNHERLRDTLKNIAGIFTYSTEEKEYTTVQEKFDVNIQWKNPCPTNRIYKRDLFLKHNIQWAEGVYCEDRIFTLKAVYFANGIVTVPNVNYYYFDNPKSTVNNRKVQHFKKLRTDKNDANKEVLYFLKV